MNEALVVCVRGIISFFTLLIFTRLLGKQQLGEITFFDYILGITIGSFAASLTIDLSSAAWPHWVGLLTWIALGFLMQILSLKKESISGYINDEPTVVIYDGKIFGDNLKKSKFTLNEILLQLRQKDIFNIDEVKLAVIETNGQISVITNEKFTGFLNSINLPSNNPDVNCALIFNGIIIDNNLSKRNLDRQWLSQQLKNQGYNSPIEVFYAFIDNNRLIINTYKNKIICSKDIFK